MSGWDVLGIVLMLDNLIYPSKGSDHLRSVLKVINFFAPPPPRHHFSTLIAIYNACKHVADFNINQLLLNTFFFTGKLSGNKTV